MKKGDTIDNAHSLNAHRDFGWALTQYGGLLLLLATLTAWQKPAARAGRPLGCVRYRWCRLCSSRTGRTRLGRTARPHSGGRGLIVRAALCRHRVVLSLRTDPPIVQ